MVKMVFRQIAFHTLQLQGTSNHTRHQTSPKAPDPINLIVSNSDFDIQQLSILSTYFLTMKNDCGLFYAPSTLFSELYSIIMGSDNRDGEYIISTSPTDWDHTLANESDILNIFKPSRSKSTLSVFRQQLTIVNRSVKSTVDFADFSSKLRNLRVMVQGQDGKTSLSTNEYLLAGSVSGFVARAVVQPLDVIKIRFQLQMEPIEISRTSKYQGLIQAVRCISKEEGTIAFWKGHVPAQIQSMAFTSVQFLSFEVILSWLHENNSLLISDNKILGLPITYKPVGNFLCGCGAGFVAAVMTQPLDVLRTRFIAQGEPKTYGSMSHAAACIISREGARGFFRGIVPSLLLIAPQTGIQFAIYHSVNQMINQGRDYLDPNLIDKASQFHSCNRPIEDMVNNETDKL
ncbi:Mitochondrial thiamine pyrophosphate carrier [Schistosoma japonicum]|nr:Mitochondrial thiamine pyrophosphate carrier [Schistosoma japonicum]